MAALGLVPCVLAQVPAHPRLIVDDDGFAELRDRTHPVGSPSTWSERQKIGRLCYRSIVQSANFLDANPDVFMDQGRQLKCLMLLSMAHRLRDGEPDYDGRYASRALAFMTVWANSVSGPSYDGWGDLGTGELLVGWSLAFDWLYEEVAEAGRVHQEAENLIRFMQNQEIPGWVSYCNNDNNHVGIAYGGRVMAALALEGEPNLSISEAQRLEWLEFAVTRLGDYLRDGYGRDGVAFDGLFYANYAMVSALPAALAVNRLSALPSVPELDVAGNPEFGVQQAGTWMFYDQLPYELVAGTPLNDTAVPGVDQNPWNYRGWPWLLGFGHPDRPSAVLQFFKTIYPPAQWEQALALDFDADDYELNAPEAVPFTRYPHDQHLFGAPYYEQPTPWHYLYNAVPILLAWPDETMIASGAFLEPDAMPLSRSFAGHAMGYFRSSLPSIGADGYLNHDPHGTLIAFACRTPAEYSLTQCLDCYGQSVPGHHGSHAQLDVNHFVAFAHGAPLFYDCGYGSGNNAPGPSNSSAGHNLCEVKIAQEWVGPGTICHHEGEILGMLAGAGRAPFMAAGDRTPMWVEGELERDQRHLFVLPRASGRAPYLIVYDDMDFAGEDSRQFRWHWHSDNQVASGDCPFLLHEGRATLYKNDAGATATVLAPEAPVGMYATTYFPYKETWPEHERCTFEFGARERSDLAVLVEIYSHAGTEPCSDPPGLELQATPLNTNLDEGAYAYLIEDGEHLDIIALRRADLTDSEFVIEVGSRWLATDAQHVIIRFDGIGGPENLQWADIRAGLFAHGTYAEFDDVVVMAIGFLGGGGAAGNLTFSEDLLEVQHDCEDVLASYLVGPLIPDNARINGQETPVAMAAIPHPLHTAFARETVGRSPSNLLVPSNYAYTVDAVLRDWQGAPVANWPREALRFRITEACPNPVSAWPASPSEGDGSIRWGAGSLTSGGAHRVAQGNAVIFEIHSTFHGWLGLRAVPAITSPDIDGNGAIEDPDPCLWSEAYVQGEPLFLADLDLSGDLGDSDIRWCQSHRHAAGVDPQGECTCGDPTELTHEEDQLDHVIFAPVHPNPFSEHARFRFGLPRADEVHIEIFDLQGRLIRRLASGIFSAGGHMLSWDARDARGAAVDTGVYLYRFRTSGEIREGRLMLTR